jgi:hypothetical protein
MPKFIHTKPNTITANDLIREGLNLSPRSGKNKVLKRIAQIETTVNDELASLEQKTSAYNIIYKMVYNVFSEETATKIIQERPSGLSYLMSLIEGTVKTNKFQKPN